MMTNELQILVVDDDPQIRTLLSDCLLSMGKKITVVATGSEAIQVMRETPCDLVLMDYEMPGLNGLETALSLKEISPMVTIIIMSGNWDAEARRKVERNGFEFLVKPFNYSDVRELVLREELETITAGGSDLS